MDHSLFTYLYNSTNHLPCCYTKKLCFHGHHDSANWRSCQLNQSWRIFLAQKHIRGQIQVKTLIAGAIVTSFNFTIVFFNRPSLAFLFVRSSECVFDQGQCFIPGSAQLWFPLGFTHVTSFPFTVLHGAC